MMAKTDKYKTFGIESSNGALTDLSKYIKSINIEYDTLQVTDNGLVSWTRGWPECEIKITGPFAVAQSIYIELILQQSKDGWICKLKSDAEMFSEGKTVLEAVQNFGTKYGIQWNDGFEK